MKTEHWRKFIDSLEGEKGLPEEMHGWRFDTKIDSVMLSFLTQQGQSVIPFVKYMIERCRRAESRQIPDLKEKVKELVLDAMDAEDDYAKECLRKDPEASVHAKLKVCDAFRALCAPDKGGEVKP